MNCLLLFCHMFVATAQDSIHIAKSWNSSGLMVDVYSSHNLILTHEPANNFKLLSDTSYLFNPNKKIILKTADLDLNVANAKFLTFAKFGSSDLIDKLNLTTYKVHHVLCELLNYKNALFNTDGSEPKNWISHLSIGTSEIDSLQIQGHFTDIVLSRSDINHLNIDHVKPFNKLEVANCKLFDVSFGDITVDTVRLKSLNFLGQSNGLDFSFFQNSKKIILILKNLDFNRLKIPLDRFKIVIDSAQSYENQVILYQLVIKGYANAGLSESVEELDKKFQALKLLHNHHPILNWISKNWWDYGYNKGQVFFIACWAFLAFFIINIVLFKSLTHVYYPPKIEEYIARVKEKTSSSNRLINIILISPGIFLYTAYIFWGLKLDLKELNIKNWLAMAMILTEYVFGIICLAYLANYVITK
jgi:hypothetical protein